MLDHDAFSELLEESRDIHSDAIRAAHATHEALSELAHERRAEPVNPDEIDRYNSSRRDS